MVGLQTKMYSFNTTQLCKETLHIRYRSVCSIQLSNRWRQSVLRKGFLLAQSACQDGLIMVTLLKGQSQFPENFCK